MYNSWMSNTHTVVHIYCYSDSPVVDLVDSYIAVSAKNVRHAWRESHTPRKISLQVILGFRRISGAMCKSTFDRKVDRIKLSMAKITIFH